MAKIIAWLLAVAVIASGYVANVSAQVEDCKTSAEGKVGLLDIQAFQQKDPLPDPIVNHDSLKNLPKVEVYIARKDESPPQKGNAKDAKGGSDYGPPKRIGEAPLRGWCEAPGEIKIYAKKALFGSASKEIIVIPGDRVQVNFRFWKPEPVVDGEITAYNIEQDRGSIVIANRLNKAVEIDSKTIVQAREGGASAKIDGLLWDFDYVIRVGNHERKIRLSEKNALVRLHVDARGIRDLDEKREKKK